MERTDALPAPGGAREDKKMNDMTGLQRLPEVRPLPAAPALVPPPGARELPIDELEIQHLRTAEQIAAVVHLRGEIQLPASALADPGFHTREKKETSTASSPDSAGADNSSARSASFRWASAWPRVKACS